LPAKARLTKAVGSDRCHTKEPLVCPDHHCHIHRKAADHGNGVIRPGGWQSGNGPLGSALHGNPVDHGPSQKGAEQQQVMQHAVGQQVSQCPEFDGDQHRVPHFRLDLAREIGVLGIIRPKKT